MPRPILVVGSLNMDFVVQVDALPERGQTVSGRGFVMLPGGKGANQACAAGRLGGRCRMIGRVGRDVFGERLKASLADAGVDTSHVLTTEGEATGIALIPVEAAITRGRSLGMTTILDPAPARPLSPALLGAVDILTPNESEAFVLLGLRGSAVSIDDAAVLGRRLRALGPGTVLLKLGANGAYLSDARGGRHFPARQVEAVDATAAGDTFNGALAVALGEHADMADAVAFANLAASISVTRLGAQASIPARAEVDALRR